MVVNYDVPVIHSVDGEITGKEKEEVKESAMRMLLRYYYVADVSVNWTDVRKFDKTKQLWKEIRVTSVRGTTKGLRHFNCKSRAYTLI